MERKQTVHRLYTDDETERVLKILDERCINFSKWTRQAIQTEAKRQRLV